MAAIAVPLFDGKQNHGAINIFWIRSAFSVEVFATRYLGDLQQAAHEIVDSLKGKHDCQVVGVARTATTWAIACSMIGLERNEALLPTRSHERQ